MKHLYLIAGIVLGATIMVASVANAAFVPASIPAGGTGTTTAPSGQLLYGGKSYQSVATSTLSASGPFTVSGTLGALVGGANSTITWNGLATTSQPASSNLLVSNGAAGVYGLATSTLTASSPLTGSLTQLGSGGSLGCQTASGSQAGCLSSGDWSTFNAKQAGGFQIGTTSTVGISKLAYFTNANTTLGGVATTSLGVSAPITFSGTIGAQIGGGGGSFGCTNASAGVTGCLTGTDWSTFNNKLSSAITALGPTGQTQSGATQTLASSTAAFNGLTFGVQIIGSSNTQTFTPTISGTLNNAGLANSTIGATSPNSSLSFGSAAALGSTFTGDINLGHANSWTALQTFANATTTLLSASYASSTAAFFGTLNLPLLGTAAGAYLAVDPNGKVIATTTPAGGGSGTVGSGTTGQFPFYNAAGTTITATSSLFLAQSGNVGIGSTSPTYPLSLGDNATIADTLGLTLREDGDAFGSVALKLENRSGVNGALFQQLGSFDLVDFVFQGLANQRNIRYENRNAGAYMLGQPEFEIGVPSDPTMDIADTGVAIRKGGLSIGSTIVTPPTNGLYISGNVGIGTSSPYLPLSVNGSAIFGGTITATSTATSTFSGPIRSTCFSTDGSTCIAAGAVSSVSNSDSTLTISPTTGSVVASLALAHANSWTGLQQFSRASSTQSSVFGNAYFGGTATSTFSSTGALTLATALAVGSGGTGQTSFTAGSLLYGSGSGAVQSVTTTTPSCGAGLSCAGLVTVTNPATLPSLKQIENRSFTMASTSAFVGTTTIPLEVGYGEVWNTIKCYTDIGTVNVQFGYGTASTTLLNASTTIGTVVATPNNTMTSGNRVMVDIGTPASSPTKIVCTVNDTI